MNPFSMHSLGRTDTIRIKIAHINKFIFVQRQKAGENQFFFDIRNTQFPNPFVYLVRFICK